jgi:hypothetical protein
MSDKYTAAHFLRKVSGTMDLETTLEKAVRVLEAANIPHFVCGGFAVQEYGYPYLTEDVDIIVPNVQEARDALQRSDLFRKNPGSSMTVTDFETHVGIDVMPGGKKVDSKNILPLPMPTMVSKTPQLLSIDKLLETKLSAGRMKDFSAVVELIKANHLPKNLVVDASVVSKYQELWDIAQEEKPINTSDNSSVFN